MASVTIAFILFVVVVVVALFFTGERSVVLLPVQFADHVPPVSSLRSTDGIPPLLRELFLLCAVGFKEEAAGDRGLRRGGSLSKPVSPALMSFFQEVSEAIGPPGEATTIRSVVMPPCKVKSVNGGLDDRVVECLSLLFYIQVGGGGRGGGRRWWWWWHSFPQLILHCSLESLAFGPFLEQ